MIFRINRLPFLFLVHPAVFKAVKMKAYPLGIP